MSARSITRHLLEDCMAARAHFEVWWALRNLALPKFLPTMNEYEYVDFFHASNAGHYMLFFIALSRIFDRDPRTAGVRELRRALRAEGHTQLAVEVANRFKPHAPVIGKVMRIRNQAIAHNERALTRSKIYNVNGVTPNEIRAVIDCACETTNRVAKTLGMSTVVSDSGRLERATLKMLTTLQRGRARGLT